MGYKWINPLYCAVLYVCPEWSYGWVTSKNNAVNSCLLPQNGRKGSWISLSVWLPDLSTYHRLRSWKIRLLLHGHPQAGSFSSLLTFALLNHHMTFGTTQAGIFMPVLSCCFQEMETCSSWLWHSLHEHSKWTQTQMYRSSANLPTTSGTQSAFQAYLLSYYSN